MFWSWGYILIHHCLELFTCFKKKNKFTFYPSCNQQESIFIQFCYVSGSNPSGFIYYFCCFIRFVEVTHEYISTIEHHLKNNSREFTENLNLGVQHLLLASFLPKSFVGIWDQMCCFREQLLRPVRTKSKREWKFSLYSLILKILCLDHFSLCSRFGSMWIGPQVVSNGAEYEERQLGKVIDKTHLTVTILVGIVYLDFELCDRFACRSRPELVGERT